MTRAIEADYAGPTRKATHAKLRKLNSDWVIQPKHDGVYARIVLDGRGLISQISSRARRPFGCENSRSLIGVYAGAPDSVLHGELESSTECGLASAANRGWPLIQVFDCSRLNGRDISRHGYGERRDALMRMHAQLQQDDTDRDWWQDKHGCVHHEKTGRFTRPIPRGWRRVPIVEQWGMNKFGEQWRNIELTGGEGLVLVNTKAPLGARGSKLKLKKEDTTDARVLRTDDRRVLLDSHGVVFGCPVGSWVLEQGEMVELTSNGFYSSGIPRHPRIKRMRTDLC